MPRECPGPLLASESSAGPTTNENLSAAEYFWRFEPLVGRVVWAVVSEGISRNIDLADLRKDLRQEVLYELFRLAKLPGNRPHTKAILFPRLRRAATRFIETMPEFDHHEPWDPIEGAHPEDDELDVNKKAIQLRGAAWMRGPYSHEERLENIRPGRTEPRYSGHRIWRLTHINENGNAMVQIEQEREFIRRDLLRLFRGAA